MDAVSPLRYETYRQDSYRAAIAKIIYLCLQSRADQVLQKILQGVHGCRDGSNG